eukprot:TRINITY_DN106919_c0_g1_i1.p1 TRINITY_DN106919_c0_g1~~TRINITY_DN106919_c0_g1_i1.p1  ORF type:complete len:260 (+),score=65.12 TRINITY_DN106919_c0_g1_i1:97-876(+)
MGKKRGLATTPPSDGSDAKKKKPDFWCWYCNYEAKNEEALIRHQQARHYRCQFCEHKSSGGHCLSLPGLVVHARRVHGQEVKKVPNAIEGRDSLSVELYGMHGIPEEDLKDKGDAEKESKKEGAGNEGSDEPPPPPPPDLAPPPPPGTLLPRKPAAEAATLLDPLAGLALPNPHTVAALLMLPRITGRWMHSAGGEVVVSQTGDTKVSIRHWLLGVSTMEAHEFIIGGLLLYMGHQGMMDTSTAIIRWTNGSLWTRVIL